jgi:hypothetical protein
MWVNPRKLMGVKSQAGKNMTQHEAVYIRHKTGNCHLQGQKSE